MMPTQTEPTYQYEYAVVREYTVVYRAWTHRECVQWLADCPPGYARTLDIARRDYNSNIWRTEWQEGN